MTQLPDVAGAALTAGPFSAGDRYELLLSKLARVEAELERTDKSGRSAHLEDASSILFDLLYSLDFKEGGEAVPRLAALYGYIGNELLAIGKTGDKTQLANIRDIIATLRQSWYESTNVA